MRHALAAAAALVAIGVVAAIACAGPSVLTLPEPPAFAEPGANRNAWLLAAAVASAGAAGLILAAIAVDRRRRGDDADRAFRVLAPKLGLSRRERRALRSIAERAGVAPAALLLSPEALARALRTISPAPEHDRRGAGGRASGVGEPKPKADTKPGTNTKPKPKPKPKPESESEPEPESEPVAPVEVAASLRRKLVS